MQRPSLDEIFGQSAPMVSNRPSLQSIFAEPTAPKEISGDDGGAMASRVQGFNSLVPFGERISAGLASGVLAPFTDLTFDELYDTARANQKATKEANPSAYNEGMAAGAVNSLPMAFGFGGAKIAAANAPKALTGTANALQKTSKATANFIGAGGNIATKAGRSAAVAAPSAALYAYGGSDKSGWANPERLSETKQAAGVGAALGAALPLAAGAVGGLTKEAKSLAKATPKTSEELRKASNPFFDKFTKSGATYSSQLTDELANLAQSVKATGIAGQTKAADQALNDALDYYEKLRGKALSPADIQKLDQSLADDVARFNKAGEYNFGRVLNDLKYQFRARAFDPQNAAKYVQGGSPDAVNDLLEGNRLWSQSYKAKDVEKILQKARGTENPQTSIRTGLKNLLADDKKMAGYTAQERKILEEAMKRGITGGGIKLFGGRLIDSLLGGAVGFGAGGAGGAIAGAVAGKAVGGIAADAAGAIQANRLKGGLQKIQAGAKPKSITPVGRAAAPAAVVAPAVAQPTTPPMRVTIPTGETLNTYNSLPEPKIDLPAIGAPLPPESNAQPDLMQRMAQVESGGNPDAKNPNSSASGLYGFTNDTWNASVQRWGKELGVSIKDKNNPEAQAKMAKKLAESNSAYIKKNTGQEPDDGQIYLAHFMGAPAAVKLMRNYGKGVSAAMLFPKEAKANQAIFFEKGGKPRTIEQVYELVTSKVG